MPESEGTFDAWAIVELMGHKRLAGRVTEQTIGGANLLRVDVPAAGGHDAFCKLFGASAIYCITPVSEAIARAATERLREDPIPIYMAELQPLVQQALQAGDDDADEADLLF